MKNKYSVAVIAMSIILSLTACNTPAETTSVDNNSNFSSVSNVESEVKNVSSIVVSDSISSNSSSSVVSNVEKSNTEIVNKLIEIDNWLISDIWNDGFCDFNYFEETGKDATGQEIDIDFAYSRFLDNFKKKDEYNEFINSLSDDYSKVKSSWEKLSDEADKLFEHYKDGVTQSGKSIDTSLFVQYRQAFSEDVYKIPSKLNSSENASNTISNNTVSVDTGMATVDVTIPASFITDLETTKKEADENEGIISYEINADGSITYKYKKSAYNEMLDEMKQSIDKSIQDMANSGNYSSVVSIEYDKKTFSDITINVTNQSDYENSMDSMILFGIEMNLGFYNAFSGTETNTVIHIVDNSNGNEFKTVNMDDKDNQ